MVATKRETVQSSETRMTLRPQKRDADDQPRILAALYILAELSQHRSEHMIPQRRAHAEVLRRESVVALVVFQQRCRESARAVMCSIMNK